MVITERLFTWSFRVAVAARLRWGDLLNTDPTTTVLMKEGLFALAAKTKTSGKSEGTHWGWAGVGPINFYFLTKKLSGGYLLTQNKAGGPPRDFWICQPLAFESELGSFNQDHAFGIAQIKLRMSYYFLQIARKITVSDPIVHRQQ